MTATIYKTGRTTHDSATGIRQAWAIGSSITRASMLDQSTQAAFQVTAAKTYYITQVIMINIAGSGSAVGTLMYDDDGAGTNEVEVFFFRIHVHNGDNPCQLVFDTLIQIPAEKYLTIKSSSANFIYGYVTGFEE